MLPARRRDLSIRYITDRHLPDKAIDLIDEAASRVRLRHSSTPVELKETQKELERIAKEKEAAVNDQDYARARSCATPSPRPRPRPTSCAVTGRRPSLPRRRR